VPGIRSHLPPTNTVNRPTIPSVSVIVPAYTEDRWATIVRSLASACGQSVPPLEVILAVDHNPDLAERARTQFKGVHVCENVGPKGASGARNTGVSNSHGEILVFLDDDQVATPDWLHALCGNFDDPSVLGVGGKITPTWPADRPHWLPREFDWVVGGSYLGMPEVVAPIRNVWSGNMAIRRSVFEAVGGFRAGFGKIGDASRPEDTDLCLRVREAFPWGHWLYDPVAAVSHVVPHERTTRKFFLKRCWNEGRGKANLAEYNGVDASTAAERHYVKHVLPRGAFREMFHAIVHCDVNSFQRGLMIVAGFSITAAGLVAETFASRIRPLRRKVHALDEASVNAPQPMFRPIYVGDWDVADPFPPLTDECFDGSNYSAAQFLIRLATEPLGSVEVTYEDAGSLPITVATAASAKFLGDVNARLKTDGLSPVTEIPVTGLPDEVSGRLSFAAQRNHLMSGAPKISVVVCTRDRPARVVECVRRLSTLDYPSFEIVVVDNAPQEPEAVPSGLATITAAVPLRYMIEAHGGLSRARNTGWRAAQGEIVAFLDDDVVPDRYWLAEILRGFSAGPEVGCVTGMVLPAELRTQSQVWFEEFGGFCKGRGFEREIFNSNHPQSPLYPLPQFGAGANMAFRRSALENIGGFDVALGAGTPTKGSEDTYAFTRTLLGRNAIVYQPTAVTWHYHRETVDGLKEQLLSYGVATSAFYAALLRFDIRLLIPLVRLIPTAVKDLSRDDSLRTAKMQSFPKHLARTEFRGLITGGPVYAWSMIRQRIETRALGRAK
jgi:O-antigen biosynthesis protein